MPMLPARHYESQHTKFMRELAQQKPDIPQQQREARAIWWDKDPKELAEDQRRAAGGVPQKPYVYGSE